jgi:soluble lytic murein transglycosylase-like protein
MKNGPSLVILGTIIGSILVGLVGWLLAKNIELHPGVEVAYAAASVQEGEQQALTGAECLVSHKYPQAIMQWCEIISGMADQAELPPNLVAAVILQESGGDPAAYSSSGAVGLMQVMPRDGIAASFECINGPCFASRPTIQELQDPRFNIQYGTQMLAGLIAKTGSQREALKAYGPMDVAYSYADKVLAIYDRYH